MLAISPNFRDVDNILLFLKIFLLVKAISYVGYNFFANWKKGEGQGLPKKKKLLVNNWFHGKNQKRQCTLSPKSSQNLKPTKIQLIETLSCFKKE